MAIFSGSSLATFDRYAANSYSCSLTISSDWSLATFSDRFLATSDFSDHLL